MNRSIILNDLLKDGFSLKYANFYLRIVEKENNNQLFDKEYTQWAHSKGFLASWAGYYGLTEQNYKNYLSDYDFYRIWPCNDWTKIWVNDKLTLKFLLQGTSLDCLMPRYYYYSTRGQLRCLPDCKNDNSINGFVKTLKEVGSFACKPNNGTMSQGFYRLAFENDCFFINESEVALNEIEEFVVSHPNYIFTEYLVPSAFFKKMNPLIHTIRINTINKHGNDPKIIGAWVRIPTNKTTDVNRADLGNPENYNLITRINIETGELCDSKLAYANYLVDTDIHPDTGIELSGVIDNWNTLKNQILEFCTRYGTLEFLGFDFGATDDGFRCMEVNTHPGIMYDQMYLPWMSDEFIGDYFKQKIEAIDKLPQEGKNSRNHIK